MDIIDKDIVDTLNDIITEIEISDVIDSMINTVTINNELANSDIFRLLSPDTRESRKVLGGMVHHLEVEEKSAIHIAAKKEQEKQLLDNNNNNNNNNNNEEEQPGSVNDTIDSTNTTGTSNNDNNTVINEAGYDNNNNNITNINQITNENENEVTNHTKIEEINDENVPPGVILAKDDNLNEGDSNVPASKQSLQRWCTVCGDDGTCTIM